MADPTLADVQSAISMQEGPSLTDVRAAIEAMQAPKSANNIAQDHLSNIEQKNLSGEILGENDFTKPGESIPKEGGLKNFVKYNVSHFQPNNRNNLLGMATMTGGVGKAAAPEFKVNTDFLKAKEPMIQEVRGSASDSPVTGLANLLKKGTAKVTGYLSHEHGMTPIIESSEHAPGGEMFSVRSSREGMAPTQADLRAARAANTEPAAAGAHSSGIIDHGAHLAKDMVYEGAAHVLGLPPGVITALRKGAPMAVKALIKSNNALLPVFEAEAGALPKAIMPAGAAINSANNQGGNSNEGQ